MKIKICGITRVGDARSALDAGADLLGFNFYPASPRGITPEKCAKILSDLDGYQFQRVGVFVNETPESIQAVMQRCGLDLAQLSGDEPPELLAALQGRTFKAIRPPNVTTALAEARRYASIQVTPALLVDAFRSHQYGGTGQTGNWQAARDLADRYSILLAGGLTPDNVGSAVDQVHPWGVDVASGVESKPGCKDPNKLIEFVKAVRSREKEA
jgi:phosphoribosylanthranilate isomerase